RPPSMPGTATGSRLPRRAKTRTELSPHTWRGRQRPSITRRACGISVRGKMPWCASVCRNPAQRRLRARPSARPWKCCGKGAISPSESWPGGRPLHDHYRNLSGCSPSKTSGYNFLVHVIEILGLEKTYSVGFWRKRPKRALHPLYLNVEEGQIFGFLGPNGAGKTTTLKMLMGLVFPTGGTARILDMELDDPRMKAQIGFLPEQPYFYDYLTARELLRYYGQLSGMESRQLGPRVNAVLEQVGLKDAANVQLRKFSKGMLQRAGIAQAILHDPKVVFLDEPMSGLDPMGRREVRNLIEQLK